MKTKILIIGLFLGIIWASVSFTQTDTSRTYFINKVKVTPGKYYQLTFFNYPPQAGKLAGVNENTVLIFTDNSISEYYIADIISMKEIEPEYIINTSNYSAGKRIKSTWSISAGYTNNKREDYYYYYDEDYEGNKGFNIQGDMAVKLSDYFGFRADVNYIHTFGTTKETTYNAYYYNTYKTEYGDNNIFFLKTGIIAGSMRDDIDFIFFIYLGGGMSYTFPYEVTEHSSYYGGTGETYSYDQGDEMELGFTGSLRLGYRITKKYSFFIEPSFHWWSGDTDRTININGGITFHI